LCTRCRTSVTIRSGWARECLVRGLVWGTREDLVASPASKMDWWRLWCASGADEVRDDLGRLERLARETLEFVDWGDQGDGIVLLVRESWTDMNDVLSRFSGQFARKGPFTLAGIRLGAHKDSVTFWHRKGAHALWGVDEVEASALESFFSIWNGHTETVRAAWDAALLLERAACSESGS